MTKSRVSEETTTADLPGFKEPRRQPSDDPLDPETTTVSPPPSAPRDSATLEDDSPAPRWEEATGPEAADFSDDFDVVAEPTPTTTSPTGPSPASFLDPTTFEEPIGAVVGLASLGVHYARRADGDLWIADEEDVHAIAAPLARIAARHAPMGAGQANDLSDGIAVAIGATNYAIKNIQREAAYRSAAPPPAPAPEDNGAGFPGPPA